jgi:cell division septum initiation protein DivIVA
VSLDGTLDRLSFVVRSAQGVPLSASCVVNRAELLALVEQARADLPAEIDDALALLRRREDVMRVAEREAESLVTEARRRAAELVDASAVVFRAEVRAQEIVEAATAKARQARLEADDWCDRRLGAVEAELDRTLGQLRRGRAVLEERLGRDRASAGGGSDAVAADELAADPSGDGVPDGQLVIDLRDGRRPGRWSSRSS